MPELPVVLVVEDAELLQNFVEETLADGGFEPVIAASGEEAVPLLKGHKGRYRALVTDINLKGKMDGWEVARCAREVVPEFPVVYMSGASAADWTSKGVPNSIMFSKAVCASPTSYRSLQPSQQWNADYLVRLQGRRPAPGLVMWRRRGRSEGSWRQAAARHRSYGTSVGLRAGDLCRPWVSKADIRHRS